MRMKLLISGLFAVACSCLWSASEIKVDLKLDGADFISGERIRGVVNIVNSSPEKLSVGYADSADRFFVEVFRAGDQSQLSERLRGAFVARFYLEPNQGMKLETFLADHYALKEPSRYLAKPVLVHRGMRYEGQIRAFDVVEGIRVASALQLFSNRRGLQREFEIVYWSRNHAEHVFLKARDVFDGGKRPQELETRDLGSILRIDKPTISILPTGEVVVFHRLNQDQYVRSEFWSLPDTLEFRRREAVQDPETAGTQRVRELYKDKGVKAKENPWWKFW